jgi:hypothetical protein
MILTILGLLTAAVPQAAPDPLAPARQGKVRCIAPDAAKKTCQSIIQYTPHEDGSFDARVAGIVRREPSVVVIYRTSGAVEGELVCSTVRPYDLLHGDFFQGDKPLTGALGQQVHDELMLRLQAIAGQKRCYTDRVEGGQLHAAVTLNGIAHPEMDQTAIWVSPDEGYALGE